VVTIALDREARIVSMNGHAREYTRAAWGRVPSPGESMLAFAAPGTEDAFVRNLERARAGESVVVRRVISYPSGLEIAWTVQYEPVWHEGRVEQVLFLAVDDTPDVTRSLALRIYREALVQSLTPLVLCDAREVDMPIIFANAAFERLTGYPMSEVLGRNCRFLQGTDRGQPAAAELQRAAAEGRPCDSVLRNYRADGTPFRNRVTIAPIRDAEGNVTHFLGMQTLLE
jgi:PAS domain S-box-containing protein